MKRLLQLLLTLCATAVIAAAPTPAPALAQGDTTSAVAINTKDGSELFKFAFQVRRTMKDVVDHTNAAVAYASCTECTTVAISFQVVLAGGSPSTVTPTNIALAVNEQCASCLTAAFAYQFVIAGEGPYRLTGEGERRLAALRNQLRSLEDADLTLDQLAALLDEAKAEVRDILATELVTVDRHGDTESDEAQPPPGDAEAPPASSTEPEASPTQTPTPTPTPTPEATQSPTPSPTP